MALVALTLKDFRCFRSEAFSFHPLFTMLEGPNGSGKSSVLEAIHLVGTLRSFRTPYPRDMIYDGEPACAVKGFFRTAAGIEEEIFVAHASHQRNVKRNGVPLEHRKDLLTITRIITATEPDLGIVQGFPEMRRTFIDQALISTHPELYTSLARYQQIVRHRNALIGAGILNENYRTWTDELKQSAQEIRTRRQAMLTQITDSLQELLNSHGKQLGITTFRAAYRASTLADEWDIGTLAQKEFRLRRACIGSQLDDIEFQVDGHGARRYASRGFQKLLMLLLKLSQVQHASGERLFLLDDFITDFDEQRIAAAVELLLTTKTQIVLTVPRSEGLPLRTACERAGGLIIPLEQQAPLREDGAAHIPHE